MTRLLLVRHAMPAVEPDVPAGRWRLTEDGRAAARALRPSVPAGARFVASDERKAIETLVEMSGGAPVAADPDLREAGRPDGWDADYRSRARSYLLGEPLAGWEPRERVAARFARAVDRHARTGPLVIGTHGLAATIWLAVVAGVDPVPFWERLRFPDVVHVDVPRGGNARISPAH
jgi:broad specificity phosphatase PhoE